MRINKSEAEVLIKKSVLEVLYCWS